MTSRGSSLASPHGVVVDNVYVSALPYVPARSVSAADTDCLNASVTGSLLIARDHASSVLGVPVSAANSAVGTAPLVA